MIFPVLLSPGTSLAQEAEPGPARHAAIEDIRSRGRVAVREWVDARRDAEARRKSAVRAEYDACLELVVILSAEGAPDAVPDVLVEAEERLKAGRGDKRPEVNRARMHANLGVAHYRIVGDARSARRLFQVALEIDPRDEVALGGLAEIQRDEEIDLQKEIEAERLLEIERELERMPRSRPAERPRAVSSPVPAQP